METKYKESLIRTLGFAFVVGTLVMPMLKQPEAKTSWNVSTIQNQTIAERRYIGLTRLIDTNSDGVLDNIEYFGRVSGNRNPSETDQRIYKSLINQQEEK